MDAELQILDPVDDGRYCLTLMGADEPTYQLFDEYELQGGGYTWEGILRSLVGLRMPEAASQLNVGAEADNAYVYCRDRALLERLERTVRAAIADHSLLRQAIESADETLE